MEKEPEGRLVVDDKVTYEKRTDWLRWFFDPNYIGHRKYPGWTGFIPFYRMTCGVHGVFEDYPHGHGKILRCPECRKVVPR